MIYIQETYFQFNVATIFFFFFIYRKHFFVNIVQQNSIKFIDFLVINLQQHPFFQPIKTLLILAIAF